MPGCGGSVIPEFFILAAMASPLARARLATDPASAASPIAWRAAGAGAAAMVLSVSRADCRARAGPRRPAPRRPGAEHADSAAAASPHTTPARASGPVPAARRVASCRIDRSRANSGSSVAFSASQVSSHLRRARRPARDVVDFSVRPAAVRRRRRQSERAASSASGMRPSSRPASRAPQRAQQGDRVMNGCRRGARRQSASSAASAAWRRSPPTAPRTTTGRPRQEQRTAAKAP